MAMGVPLYRWMVFVRENPIEIDDLGGLQGTIPLKLMITGGIPMTQETIENDRKVAALYNSMFFSAVLSLYRIWNIQFSFAKIFQIFTHLFGGAFPAKTCALWYHFPSNMVGPSPCSMTFSQ